MRGYYYRARDQAGRKHTGTIEAFDRHSASATLRRNGLRPYFIFDYHVVKKIAQRKKKRERVLIVLGVLLILASFPISTYIVRRAEERAPSVEDYARTGILTGASGIIVAEGEDERALAQDTYEAWETLHPGMITGVEVTRFIMSIYVNAKVREVSDNDLESLGVTTIRAHHRRLGSKAVQLLVVEDEMTLMEVEYNVLSGTPHVKSYR